jgi:thymidylate kinase
MTPTALQALHVAAHLDGLESFILPALEQGANLVLDRFWWSMEVYGKTQGVSEASISALHTLELTGWHDVLPDVVFLVERDQPFTSEALASWDGLVDAYTRLAEQEAKRYPVMRLKNDSPLESVHEAIVSTLTHLKLRG